MSDKQANEPNQSMLERPETARDLINILRSFPPDSMLSFAPFNLQSVNDEGGKVQFAMCELEGTHYEMKPNTNG